MIKIIKKLINKIFYKRYKISEDQNSKYIYECNGRIIRSLKDDDTKKSYCAAYIFSNTKKL